MVLSATVVIVLISLIIALTAIYNAYLLRGGNLAWSQVFIVFGMLFLVFSQVWEFFLSNSQLIPGFTVTDILFILGFVFLLLASVKLRLSLG
jgi:drug/metabolite transporter (DMT)-like permease